ncbi:MAG: RsmD family RNA methyltransferase [Lentimicrobium sp.]|nr:RsmD family RNA methyltransferase [Lentimicrobium sp.]
MRIISGTHKSRQIHAPKNLPVRPTTDIAKEALFNILINNFDLEDVQVLDLFAGTGNITYEFASRGALGVTSIDKDLRCVNFIRKTAMDLGFEAILSFRSDAFRFLKNSENTYDIIFCDPPYELEGIEEIPVSVFERRLLKDEGWLILEHSRDYDFSKLPGFLQQRKYGKVNFSIFKENTEEA